MKLSFQLEQAFVDTYRTLDEPFGFNGLGSLTFYRTYSRRKPDGSYESWVDVCQRVINGMYSIQKDHCAEHNRPWDEHKAQESAQEAFDRMFNLKWTPSGRGLWMVGTPFIHERKISEALQNCAFLSTQNIEEDRGEIFRWFMEMLMLGVGVGADVRGAGKVFVGAPEDFGELDPYVIEDTRESWAESVAALVSSYLYRDATEYNYAIDKCMTSTTIYFDYSRIRKKGKPIKGFGGTSSGPEPLMKLHDRIREYMDKNCGSYITARTLVDIFNAIGGCVVAGNVRRCLPEDAPIKTNIGYVPMKDVKIGDTIVTAEGISQVTNKFDQGVQDTIKIKHYFGEFECTPNHKVAVFVNTNEWIFKQAKDVIPGDRLVYDPSIYPGDSQEFDTYWSNINPKSTTGSTITLPNLDTNVAWLLGLIAGDGYVFMPSDTTQTPNGMVSIACSNDYPEIIDRAVNALSLFGLSARVKQAKDGKYYKIEIYNTDFAKWVYENIKRPKTDLFIPAFIKTNTVDIRAAWLAGLFDADGSSKTRPLNGVATIYANFAQEIKLLYNGIGIGAYIRTTEREQEGWQDINNVCIKGVESVKQFNKIVAPHCSKYEYSNINVSRNSFSYPGNFVGRKANVSSWNIDPSKKPPVGLPVAVLSVSEGRTVQTYDIEVEGIHQFTADGIVCHNSAEIMFADFDDEDFANLKNYEINPERAEIAWASNNSFFTPVGSDYSTVVGNISKNGEPGFYWLENAQKYGRMGEEMMDNAIGGNPCLEQPLAHKELCNLVEVYMNRHDDLYDYLRTLKFAYLYGKTMTLTYEWIKDDETREIMKKNRRIGLSNTGIAQFLSENGLATLIKWLDKGYDNVRHYDGRYSMWFDINESIRVTTVKPSGSVSLLAGSTPGIHHPISEYYIRRIRLQSESDLVKILGNAGLYIEDDVYSDNTVCVEFPIHVGEGIKQEKDLSVWEQFALAAVLQKYWSDNAVSITVKFDPHKTSDEELAAVLNYYQYQLKGVSLLPEVEDGAYPQMPYEPITKEKYEKMLEKINMEPLNNLARTLDQNDKMYELYCTTDYCEFVPVKKELA